MSKITAIKPADRFKKRQKIFLDGEPAFSLAAEVVKESHLKVGQELDDEKVAALVAEDKQARLRQSTQRYLGYRPQSEAELKQKLERKGVPQTEIEAACARFKADGLLNNGRFARFWKENREAFAPRSQRLVSQELRRKGVSQDVIAQVTGEMDDRESAYRAAIERARRLSTSDYQVFATKLGGYLQRRGFGYEIIRAILARVWEEMGGASENCSLSSGGVRRKFSSGGE